MMRGRKPAWNPVGVFADTAWLEPVEVTSKDRLVLPASVRKRLGWGLGGGTVRLLGVMEANGRLELLPWDPRGIELMKRVEAALDATAPTERGDLALAAMDRYLNLGLTPDGRLHLPPPLVIHLDAAGRGVVRVGASGGRLWIWSERAWEASRSERFAKLDEALGQKREESS